MHRPFLDCLGKPFDALRVLRISSFGNGRSGFAPFLLFPIHLTARPRFLPLPTLFALRILSVQSLRRRLLPSQPPPRRILLKPQLPRILLLSQKPTMAILIILLLRQQLQTVYDFLHLGLFGFHEGVQDGLVDAAVLDGFEHDKRAKDEWVVALAEAQTVAYGHVFQEAGVV